MWWRRRHPATRNIHRGIRVEPLEARCLFSVGEALSSGVDPLATVRAADSNSVPVITTQPVNRISDAGKTVHFTALVDSASQFSVQWQISTDGGRTFQKLSGNATARFETLTLAHVAASKNLTKYRAVFTNAVGTAVTQPATLTLASAGALALVVAARPGAAVVSGRSTTLTASGTSDTRVTYTWSTVKSPGAALGPTFSANGTGAAGNIKVTFRRAGSFLFRCTVRDQQGHAISSDTLVTVRQRPFRLFFRDSPEVVDVGDVVTYRADVYDQFRHAIEPRPHIHYYLKYGDGDLDRYDGTFYAPSFSDSVAIGAEALGLSDTIYIAVSDPSPPDVGDAAA